MPTASTFSAPALPADFPYPEAFREALTKTRPNAAWYYNSPAMVQLKAALWLMPQAELERWDDARVMLNESDYSGVRDDSAEVLHWIRFLEGPTMERFSSAVSFVLFERPGDVGPAFAPRTPQEVA